MLAIGFLVRKWRCQTSNYLEKHAGYSENVPIMREICRCDVFFAVIAVVMGVAVLVEPAGCVF